MQQQNNGDANKTIKDLIGKDGKPIFFTPLDASRSKRLEFKRADVVVLSGNLDVRGVGKKARVQIGSTVYDVYGSACDLPGCQCDAYIVPVQKAAARLIVQPASDKNAWRHYIETIQTPVSLDRMRQYLDASTFNQLGALYKDGMAYVWGLTPGTNNSNFAKWDRIKPGDVALFLRQKVVFASGVVTLKLRNPELASELWGRDPKGRTWEYMYFLDGVEKRQIPYEQLNKLLGYSLKNNFMQS
jgi:hypothetical protein